MRLKGRGLFSLGCAVLSLLVFACGYDPGGPPATQSLIRPTDAALSARTATVATAPSATPNAQPTDTPAPPTPLPTPTSDPQITLVAVGDMMLARSIGAAIEQDPTYSPFSAVTTVLWEADIAVGNLECALGAQGAPRGKSYTFLAPPVAAAKLAQAGFDVLSLANNHSLDYGPAAQEATLGLLDALNIAHTGAGLDEAEAHRPAIVRRKGLNIAFLAYVNVPVEGNGFDTASWEAHDDNAGLAWARPARIAHDVQAARGQADLVVVLLHSGDEGSSVPNAVQRTNARAAIDAGACLVIGAHPHVLQGVEFYGNGVIAYSLGNFVFDGFEGEANESALLHVTLTRNGVQSVHWTPVVITDGRPELASAEESAAILARIDHLSAALDLAAEEK